MHKYVVALFLAAGILLAVVVTPAAAQTGAPTHPFVIHGQAGVTFGGPSGGLFGAGAGASLAAVPGLTVLGEFGRLTNIMNGDLQDIVDELAGVDESSEFDFEFDIALPTFYGFGGARYDVTPNGPLHVFVDGGVGFARVGLDVNLVVDGEDVSDDFAEFLEAEGVASTTAEVLIVFGGGVSIPITPRASITGGFRINRIAASEGITKPAVYAGVIWRP